MNASKVVFQSRSTSHARGAMFGVLFVLGLVLSLLCQSQRAQAHELEANRLTLVQRDDRHVQLTLVVDLPAALHRLTSPAEPYAEFLVRCAAAALPDLQRVFETAKAQWQRETVLETRSGDTGSFQRWQWPEARALQAAMQENLMSLMTVSKTAGADHVHPQPQEVQAHWVASKGTVSTLKVSLPPSMKPTLVVSYRPHQQWLTPKESSTWVKF